MEKQKYLQWFCGFYEGEGSVSNDISNNNKLRLSISQNDKTPLEMAKTFWGGSVVKRTRISLKGKTCVGFEWRIGHKESLIFITDIKPFMLIPYKINQVNTALELADKGLKRRFECKTCGKDFASPSGRRRHFKNEHIIEEPNSS